MRTSLRFQPSLIFACLLFCGSAVIAQDGVGPGNPAAADHHGVDAHEHAQEITYITEHRQESFAMWMLSHMGLVGLLVLGAGFASFILTLFVVIRGQGPWACAALLFIVPIPFWVGLFSALKSLLASFSIIAMSDAAIKASEISGGISSSLVNPILGLVLMAPSYLVATLGSIFRSITKPEVKP